MKNRLLVSMLLAVAACTDTTAPDGAKPPTDLTSRFGGHRLPTPDFGYVFDFIQPVTFGTGLGIDPRGDYIVGRTQTGHGFISCTCVPFVIELEDMGESEARAVNSALNIVGSYTLGGAVLPAYWRYGDIYPLPLPTGHTSGVANALSNTGHAFTVVGYTEIGGVKHPVRWDVAIDDNVIMTELDDNGLGGTAESLDATVGIIVGGILDGAGDDYVSVWNLFDNTLSGTSIPGVARDVNAAGVIIGYDADAGVGFLMTDPFSRTDWTSPGMATEARAINSENLVVGALTDGTNTFPAVWDIKTNETFEVGQPGTGYAIANDIGNRGLIVGSASVSFGSIAFVTIADRDRDDDGIANWMDNCFKRANPGQEDGDSDNIGDVCDPDTPATFVATVKHDTRSVNTDFLLSVKNPHDPGGLPLTFEWAFSDGTAASGRSVNKSFATPGDKTATVTVGNGISSAQQTLTLHVTSSANGVFIDGGPLVATSGESVRVPVTLNYPNGDDPVHLVFDWGDGTTDEVDCEIVPTTLPACSTDYFHTYYQPATRQIKVRATDASGLLRKAAESVTVQPRLIQVYTETVSGPDRVDDALPTLQVIVRGCSCFDVRDIVRGSVTLSAGGTAVKNLSSGAATDTNGDGYRDRPFYFDMAALLAAGNFGSTPSTIVIRGRLQNGTVFASSYSVDVE